MGNPWATPPHSHPSPSLLRSCKGWSLGESEHTDHSLLPCGMLEPLGCTLSFWENTRGLFVKENKPQLCFSIVCTSEHATMEQEVPGLVTRPLSDRNPLVLQPPGNSPLLCLPPPTPHFPTELFLPGKAQLVYFIKGTTLKLFVCFFCILYLRDILAFYSFLEKLTKFKTQVVAGKKRQCYSNNIRQPWWYLCGSNHFTYMLTTSLTTALPCGSVVLSPFYRSCKWGPIGWLNLTVYSHIVI